MFTRDLSQVRDPVDQDQVSAQEKLDLISDSDDSDNEFQEIMLDDEDGDNEALMNKIKNSPYAWGSIPEEIENIKRRRHDVLHKLICEKHNIPFGERPFSDFFSSNEPDFKMIMNQTPDIILIEEEEIKIIDVTVSTSSKSIAVKKGKYELSKRVISNLTQKMTSVHCVRLNPSDYTIEQTINLIDENDLTKIYEEMERMNSRLDQLNQTEEGKRWLINSNTDNKLIEPLKFPRKLAFDQFKNFELKPFLDEDDLKDVIEGKLEEVDETQFLDHCLDSFDPKSSKMTQNHTADIQDFWNYHKNMSETMINDEDYLQSNKIFRSYLPLPNMEGLLRKSSRSTENDESEAIAVLSLMSSSLDEYCRIIGIRSKEVSEERAAKLKIPNNFKCYRTCYFTSEEKSRIALEGPGRKRYSLTSVEHQKRSLKDKNYWIHPGVDVSDIRELSFRYSKIDNIQDHPSKWCGPGLNYLRFCQEIYREININSLRKATNKCHILRPTIYEGVYIILHPGPLLKSGESSTIIWFKIIVVPLDSSLKLSLFEKNRHWKTWNYRDKIWSSKWLSTDSNRLDHYIRAYDRVIMAYTSYCSTQEMSMRRFAEEDRSNTLGLMILIYLEDKRSTSKMIQDVRYIFMMKMSVYDHSSRTLDRFKVPIRTPLQLYLLKKITQYLSLSFKECVTKLRFGKIREYRTSSRVNDKYSGADISLTRIMTDGPSHTFDQMLHEVYFCMLFNKNQDNVTHASFQILTKMLEGESSLEEVKQKTRLFVGLDKGAFQDAHYLINNDHRNQFSRTAIILGSIFQSQSRATSGYSGDTAYLYASNHSSLNKTLNEFATFKSSSMTERLIYEDLDDRTKSFEKRQEEEAYYDGHDIKDTGDEIIVGRGFQRQNRRRRCAQGVIQLMTDGQFCSFDVIKNHYDQPEYFQVFKKNQIGGVREILILSIEDRIMLNVIETFSRLICARDNREMLTHGPTKSSRFQSMLRNIRAKDPMGKIFHLNFDKSKWGPSFQPIQFLYIFYPFKEIFPDLFNYFVSLLIKHTNKRVLFPERLIRAWMRDPENLMKHNMDNNLQKTKEKFLKDKILYTKNESNMGQGILHFTSSLLHLGLISFRDKLFSRWLFKKGIDGVFWDDILSSDDSYTCLNVGSKNSSQAKVVLDNFLHCQEISERLFNCETSLSKSSISNIFCEFNSLFGVNLSLHPTRIKFALSTMDVFYTDSFVRMVKESYNVCRALFENGGQLDLFKLAHELNKEFCEDLYAVNRENDPRKILGVGKVPYQLGFYPCYDPILMLIFGPEMHNMSILSSGLSPKEAEVFNASHVLSTENIHSILEFDLNSDVYVGTRIIDAKIRPSKLINVIRRLSPMTKERVREVVEKDPLLLLRRPRTQEEIKLKVSMKLFQNSSAEAARSTNPAFFYGRMSASRTAKCFSVQGIPGPLLTYKDSILKMMSVSTKCNSKDLYPSLQKFLDARHFMYKTKPDLVYRDPFEIKRYHKLVLQENSFHLKNSFADILSHMWVRRTSDNSLERDSLVLCQKFPFMKDLSSGGIKATISGLSSETDQGLSRLLLILMRIMGDNYKPMKIISFGEDSSEIIRSIYSINTSNNSDSTVGMVDLTSETESISLTKFETVKLFLNMCFIKCLNGEQESGLELINKLNYRDIEGMMKNPYVDVKAKQLCFLILLKTKLSEDALSLVRSSDFIISKYVVEQQVNSDGEYHGPGKVIIQCSDVVMTLDTINHITTVNKLDLKITARLLKEGYRMLGLGKKYVQPQANYEFDMESLKPIKTNIRIIVDTNLSYIRFVPGVLTINENLITLKDKITKKNIIKIKNYFLPTESRHWDNDFPKQYKGCLVKDLIHMGFFSTYFALENLSRSRSLDSIVEINYDVPEISISTKESLQLSEEEEEEEIKEDDLDDFNVEDAENDLMMAINDMDISGIVVQSSVENTQTSLDVVERIDETLQMWWENGDLFNLGDYKPRQMRKESIGKILSDRMNHAGELLLTHSIYNIGELSHLHLRDIERFSSSDKYDSLRNALLFTYDYLFGGLTVTEDSNETGCISYLTPKFLDKIGMRKQPLKLKFKMKK